MRRRRGYKLFFHRIKIQPLTNKQTQKYVNNRTCFDKIASTILFSYSLPTTLVCCMVHVGMTPPKMVTSIM